MPKKNSQKPLRIGVIGQGPVGSILAAHLIEAGAYVVPCDIIPEKIEKYKASGIRLEHAIQKHVNVTDACCSIQELERYDLDLLAIAVKAPVLNIILTQLSKLSLRDRYIVCVQNGIDNEAETGGVLGEDRILRMVPNYAGNMCDMNTVNVTFFNPPNYVASLMPQGHMMAEKFASYLNAVELYTEIPDDIQDYVWEKAILNAIMGPVCAITRRTMKEVLDYPPAVDLIEKIIDESVRVAEAEGIDLKKKFRRFCMRYLKNAGPHRPSILVDLEEGRPTEIDWLNGKIVEYGRKHYIPTPLNLSILVLIHLLEQSGEFTRSR